MTKPLVEPTWPRTITRTGFDVRQLQRRPTIPQGTPEVAWVKCGAGQVFTAHVSDLVQWDNFYTSSEEIFATGVGSTVNNAAGDTHILCKYPGYVIGVSDIYLDSGTYNRYAQFDGSSEYLPLKGIWPGNWQSAPSVISVNIGTESMLDVFFGNFPSQVGGAFGTLAAIRCINDDTVSHNMVEGTMALMWWSNPSDVFDHQVY